MFWVADSKNDQEIYALLMVWLLITNNRQNDSKLCYSIVKPLRLQLLHATKKSILKLQKSTEKIANPI